MDRTWLLCLVNKPVIFQGYVARFGWRKFYHRHGSRETILLQYVAVYHNSCCYYLDHAWIDRTKRLQHLQLNDVCYAIGTVKKYTRFNGTQSFKLYRIRSLTTI